MPPSHPPIPPGPALTRKVFDPWNSSSTGHQRAENRLSGSTSWRQSRTTKLAHQFAAGAGGGKRVFDSVGAGSEDFGMDGRKENGAWERGAPGLLKEKGWRDVGAMIRGAGGKVEKDYRKEEGKEGKRKTFEDEREGAPKKKDGAARSEAEKDSETAEGEGKEKEKESETRPIFQNLTIYINGSTAPLISDHKLKHLLASHGARVSIALGRRSVTHVIVGRPNGASGGAGGGLAGGKLQKEIQRVRGCGIKFVGVEWVIESVKAGKRLGEAGFEGVRVAPRGVGSVYGMFRKGAGREKDVGGVGEGEGEGGVKEGV